MKTLRKFWPFDFDEEGEIYDNPAWNMPGFKRPSVRPGQKGKSRPVSRDRGSRR